MRWPRHGLILLVYLLFFQQVDAMFQKRSRDPEQDKQEDPAKRLKSDIADLSHSNDISAT